MFYQGYSDGIYLIRQRSINKGVDHYGVFDIGNRLNLDNADGIKPVVIHQVHPQIRVDKLEDTGSWEVLEQSLDENSANSRFWQACEDPKYDLLFNNCEQFARYVVGGKRESKQLQTAVVITGIFALTLTALQEKPKPRRTSMRRRR